MYFSYEYLRLKWKASSGYREGQFVDDIHTVAFFSLIKKYIIRRCGFIENLLFERLTLIYT